MFSWRNHLVGHSMLKYYVVNKKRPSIDAYFAYAVPRINGRNAWCLQSFFFAFHKIHLHFTSNSRQFLTNSLLQLFGPKFISASSKVDCEKCRNYNFHLKECWSLILIWLASAQISKFSEHLWAAQNVVFWHVSPRIEKRCYQDIPTNGL